MRTCLGSLVVLSLGLLPAAVEAEFRAGAVVVDVTPDKLPVLVNGGMLSRNLDKVKTPVNARAIVLADGKESLAIVVVDSCMLARELLDEAKKLAADATGIKPDHILISATHSHTAPSSHGCLGTDPDPNYVPFLRAKLVEAIVAAQKNLEPAKVGWGSINAAEYTALRRWIRRPDRIEVDPFGNSTLRANMHAGRNWDDVVGESGPEDPDLTLISFQAKDGRPIAVLANFSMHYFGDRDISADYFGLFSDGLRERIAGKAAEGTAPFVGIMSHGCSGDIYRVDYAVRNYSVDPPPASEAPTLEGYTKGLLDLAMSAYDKIEYQADADLAMAEARLHLNYRVPNKQLLEWAQRIVASMGDQIPKTTEEVYAREQVLLHERQSTDVVVQGIRIGDMAIATTPTETYAITGLKIKQQSPLAKTMVIELANGGDGYIPPPEQHLLGGYNTWPARSAGLELQAEPKITAAALGLLEQVSGQPCRESMASQGPAAKAILDRKPVAYYRLDEFAGPRAKDHSGFGRDGLFEPQMAYFLEGPLSEKFCEKSETNRAVHFVGQRLRTRIPELKEQYSVSLWFWNGMPNDGRETAGWLVSRGRDHALNAQSEHVGLGGSSGQTGCLIFQQGNGSPPAAGKTVIKRWTWNHLLLVRDGEQVRIYLNGHPEPEIDVASTVKFPKGLEELFLGGRCDNQSNWEGRLDEIAIFDKALTAEDAKRLGR